MATAEVKSVEEKKQTSGRGWDVERIREDFPVLRQTVNGKPLVTSIILLHRRSHKL